MARLEPDSISCRHVGKESGHWRCNICGAVGASGACSCPGCNWLAAACARPSRGFADESCSDAPTTLLLLFLFGILCALSARAWDAKRTKPLCLLTDSITGASRIKTSRSWAKWFVDKKGISSQTWPEDWLHELACKGIPGHDYLLMDTNSSMDP